MHSGIVPQSRINKAVSPCRHARENIEHALFLILLEPGN
jgi:hypothetical protein